MITFSAIEVAKDKSRAVVFECTLRENETPEIRLAYLAKTYTKFMYYVRADVPSFIINECFQVYGW